MRQLSKTFKTEAEAQAFLLGFSLAQCKIRNVLIDPKSANTVTFDVTKKHELIVQDAIAETPADEAVISEKPVRVEYDETYSGGNYDKVGAFVVVRVKFKNSQAEEEAVAEAFQLATGLDPQNIVHYETFSESAAFMFYPDEECPDCGWPIPEEDEIGDECRVCGHVFTEDRGPDQV